MILKTFYKDIFDYYHELLFQCAALGWLQKLFPMAEKC